METSKFEKKRGRVRRKLEAVRSGVTFETASPSSSVSEGLDTFPESPPMHTSHFTLSPETFRPRASSNASSCGRLSPIPCEPDVTDASVSQLTWTSSDLSAPQRPQARYSGEQHAYADQLAEMTFHSMTLEGSSSSMDNSFFSRSGDESQDCNQVSPASSQSTLTSLNFAFGSSVSVNSAIINPNVSSKSLVDCESETFDRSNEIDTCHTHTTLTTLNTLCDNSSSTARDVLSNHASVNMQSDVPQSMDTLVSHVKSSFIASHLQPIQRKRGKFLFTQVIIHSLLTLSLPLSKQP